MVWHEWNLYQEDSAWGKDFCKTLSLLFAMVKDSRQKPPWTISPPTLTQTIPHASLGMGNCWHSSVTCCNGRWSFDETSNQNALAKAKQMSGGTVEGLGLKSSWKIGMEPELWFNWLSFSPWHFNNPASQKGDSSPEIKEIQMDDSRWVIWPTCLYRWHWSPPRGPQRAQG
jgi:hypothetical protein